MLGSKTLYGGKAITIGTDQNDTLTGTNQPIFGLGGDDDLSTTGPRSLMFGGRGDDRLTAVYDKSVPLSGLEEFILDGGAGNDTLSVDIDVDGTTAPGWYNGSIIATGGSGDDVISITQDVRLTFDPERYAASGAAGNINVVDEFGQNNITIHSDLYSSSDITAIGGAWLSTTVVVGNAADVVNIDSTAYSGQDPATSHVTNILGGGNDLLNLKHSSGRGDIIIDAGGGHDNLTLDITTVDGNEGGTELVYSVNTGLGNDTLDITINEEISDGANLSHGVFDMGGGNDQFTMLANIVGDYEVNLGSGANSAQLIFEAPNYYWSWRDDYLVRVTGENGGNNIQIALLDDYGYENLISEVMTGGGIDIVRVSGAINNSVSSGGSADDIYVQSVGDFGTNVVDGGNGHDLIVVDVTSFR